jgi:hypothetical protein
MFDGRGGLKIVDFGVARLAQTAAARLTAIKPSLAVRHTCHRSTEHGSVPPQPADRGMGDRCAWALHLADHAGVVLSAVGLLFWDCHLAVRSRAASRSYAGVRMSSQVEHEGRALCQFHQVWSEVMRRPSTAPDIDPSRYRAGVEAIGFTENLLEGGGFDKTMTAPTDAVVHAEWSPSPRRPPTGLYATTSTDHHEAWCGARLRLILTRPFDAGLQNACPACINAFRLGYPEALLGQEKLKRGL